MTPKRCPAAVAAGGAAVGGVQRCGVPGRCTGWCTSPGVHHPGTPPLRTRHRAWRDLVQEAEHRAHGRQGGDAVLRIDGCVACRPRDDGDVDGEQRDDENHSDEVIG